MAKYQLIFEASSMKSLIENVEKELGILKEQELEAIEHDKRMKTKIIPIRHKRERWTRNDDAFIIENYRSKDVRWIASALGRSVTSVRTRMFSLYQKYPDLPRLRSKRCTQVKISKAEVVEE